MTPSDDPRRPHFDVDHYRSQLSRARRRDVQRTGGDEFDDYLRRGWREGLDPSPGFSTEGYLHDNPDVRSAGIDPLTHWVSLGRAEGRPVVTPTEFASPGRVPTLNADLARRRDDVVNHLADLGLVVDPVDLHAPLLGLAVQSPDWFDADWYLAANPDVGTSDIDPFVHYARFGFRERRWPNADVAGRAATVGSPIDRVLAARDVRIDTMGRLAVSDPTVEVAPSVVFERIRQAMADGDRRRLVIVIGHDDYTVNVGGVQLCEGLEAGEFARRGVVHVFVHPNVSLRTLHPLDGDAHVRVVIDGEAVDGRTRLVDLADGWSTSGLIDADVEAVVVHSILGHSPEQLARLIERVRPRRSLWWVHDNVSKCPNWLLLRNGVESCGAPPTTSLSCRLCAWGPERIEHLSRLQRLWSQAPWEFLAPSDSAVDSAMSGSAPLPSPPTVVPHVQLRRSATDRPPLDVPGRSMRLGFVGWPRADKGWEVFARLAAARPEGVEFVHLGAEPGLEPGIEFVPLLQTAESVGATVDAIASVRLEVVLVWPSWAETFSFVTAEAIAGGSEILTHGASGNVVAMAEQHDRAIVFESVDALVAADLAEIVRARRRHVTAGWEIVTGSGLTPAVLDPTGPSAVGP